MAKIGDMLYGLRVVKAYHGKGYEESPIFSGYQGIVVCNAWDTGDWIVLLGKMEDGEYVTEQLGCIDEDQIQSDWNGERVSSFIKEEALKIAEPYMQGNEVNIVVDEDMAGIIQIYDKERF